jgi:hypothetical protein
MDVLDMGDIEHLKTWDNLNRRQLDTLIILKGRLLQKLAYVRSTIASYEARIEAVQIDITSLKRRVSSRRNDLKRSLSAPNLV